MCQVFVKFLDFRQFHLLAVDFFGPVGKFSVKEWVGSHDDMDSTLSFFDITRFFLRSRVQISLNIGQKRLCEPVMLAFTWYILASLDVRAASADDTPLFQDVDVLQVVGTDDSIVDFRVDWDCPLVDIDFPMVFQRKVERNLVASVDGVDDIDQIFEIFLMHSTQTLRFFNHGFENAVWNQHLIEGIVAV